MSIIARKEKGDFTPAPEGLWAGVCCDVVDKGMKDTQWGPKHKVQIRWVVDADPKRDDGKPYMVSKSFTLSLHEKSNLRQVLEVWRGKKFTDQELEGFDLEVLLGAPCQIQVAQERGNDGTIYAFPQVVLKAGNGTKKVAIPKDYIRQVERDRRANLETEPDGSGEFVDEISEDDIPF